MVHVQHLSYQEIATIYGVNFTAVPYWLDKHGIRRPCIWETRKKGKHNTLPPAEELARIYNSGKSLAAIGEMFNVSSSTIKRRLTSIGTQIRRDGFKGGHREVCKDGHLARSLYELRVDDWLTDHNIEHECEPNYPWDLRYKADFLVGGTYIEVWGVSENDAYTARKRLKIRRCEEAGLDLIQINHWQFAKGRKWWKPLERLVPQFTQGSFHLEIA